MTATRNRFRCPCPPPHPHPAAPAAGRPRTPQTAPRRAGWRGESLSPDGGLAAQTPEADCLKAVYSHPEAAFPPPCAHLHALGTERSRTRGWKPRAHTVVSSPAGADPAPEGTAAPVQGVKSRPSPVPHAPPARRAASREPGAGGRQRTAPGAAASVVAAVRAGGVGPPGAALASPERGAANGGRGAARGLERARGGPADRARGGGEAGAVSAVIREGKVPCAGSRAGARSYGGRSGRAGPRRSRWRRRTPLGPRLAPLGDSVGPRRGTGGPRAFARSHGRRRGARRGARAAGGAAAHLPLGADPPAQPAGRQVAGHRASRLRHQPLGTAAPWGQPPHWPPRR